MIARQPKNPALAAFLSFILPGLGQIYNGHAGRAVVVFLCTVVGALVFVLPGVLVWIVGIVEAYRAARGYNAELEADEAAERRLTSSVCLRCGSVNRAGSNFCTSCGAKLGAAT